MSRPHRCPVCDGHGTVSRPPNIAGDQPCWSSSDLRPWPCPACEGQGVLWEPETVSVPFQQVVQNPGTARVDYQVTVAVVDGETVYYGEDGTIIQSTPTSVS